VTALLLPFARRSSDGLMVSPDEVERGAQCECVCPSCSVPVIARQGTEREWHFAHAKGGSCDAGYETSIHELAKQLIRQRRSLTLPALSASVSATNAFGHLITESEELAPVAAVQLDTCRTGVECGDVKPDLICNADGRDIHVEITVFHRLSGDKKARLEKTGVPCLEIDLSELKTTQATRGGLDAALFAKTDNRAWVFHPRIASVSQSLRTRLDAKLAADAERYSKEWQLRSAERLTAANDESRRARSAAPEPASLQWRASLPSRSVVESAALVFNEEGLRKRVLDLAFTITSRGQLAGIKPADLVDAWAKETDASPSQISEFLTRAGFAIIY